MAQGRGGGVGCGAAPGAGLRWTASGLTAVFGFVGNAFVIGETMQDLGGGRGNLLISLWLLPMFVACIVCVAQ